MEAKCPHCGAEMPEEASFCLNCMTPRSIEDLSLNTRKKSKKRQYLALLVIAAVVVTATALSLHFTRPSTPVAPPVPSTSSAAPTTAETVQADASTTDESASEATQTEPAATTETATESTTESTTETTAATTTGETASAKATTKKETTTAATKVVYNGDTLEEYPNSRRDKSYAVPSSVRKIADGAFGNNKYLKTIKFSKREKVSCNWEQLFSGLPNLKTVYVYPGTDADLYGLQYFDGEIVYYD